MLSSAQRGEIRLLGQHGFSQRHIAHLVGRNRATVRRVLLSAESGRPTSPSQPSQRRHRPAIPRKIDSFRAEALRSLTVEGLTAKQTWDELKTRGFTGSVKSVRRFARELRLHAVNRNHGAAAIQCGRSLLCADHAWLLRLMQGKAGPEALAGSKGCNLQSSEVNVLLGQLRNGKLRLRNRAAVVVGRLKGMTFRSISSFLQIGRHTAHNYWDRFQSTGTRGLLRAGRPRGRKADNQNYRDAVFKVLHAPPIALGFNRTTWRLADIKSALAADGVKISRGAIRQIIRLAGYRFRKAKKVLTSTDPRYHEKLRTITRILRKLKPDEGFFSIDEFGPFAVKIQGGRSLVMPGRIRTVPMHQRSKGRLICTAALELTTNQITHFYSERKNTDEMLKLLDMLLIEYSDKSRIFLSWDAASWHISGRLKGRVKSLNTAVERKERTGPRVALAPLPACAQFLNVIESVFSGMARAIIHNSDYPSVDACKAAIDRYFAERNRHFRHHPKRAGNKVWGKEPVPPIFAVAQNCKDPRY